MRPCLHICLPERTSFCVDIAPVLSIQANRVSALESVRFVLFEMEMQRDDFGRYKFPTKKAIKAEAVRRSPCCAILAGQGTLSHFCFPCGCRV